MQCAGGGVIDGGGSTDAGNRDIDAGAGDVDADCRRRGRRHKGGGAGRGCGAVGWGADAGRAQARDAVRATESEREGKQTHPLAFGGFGDMEKKKESPPARV